MKSRICVGYNVIPPLPKPKFTNYLLTGWSVWHQLRLLRGEELAACQDQRTLGEILVDKANRGVKVYVMVWSEKTSNNLKEIGVMGTHDMETYNYFKSTKVICALAPR